MTESERQMRVISLDQTDLLITAQVAEKENKDKFHPISFRASAVDYIHHVNDKVSAITLRNGIVIPVSIAFERLKEMVYNPDFRTGAAIDLTLVTGESVQNLLVPKLADTFNETVENTDSNPFKITAFLRVESSNYFFAHTFLETDVARWDGFETDRSKCGRSIKASFNKERAHGKKVFCIDMPYKEMFALISAKKIKGENSLDLCQVFKDNPRNYGLNPQ